MCSKHGSAAHSACWRPYPRENTLATSPPPPRAGLRRLSLSRRPWVPEPRRCTKRCRQRGGQTHPGVHPAASKRAKSPPISPLMMGMKCPARTRPSKTSVAPKRRGSSPAREDALVEICRERRVTARPASKHTLRGGHIPNLAGGAQQERMESRALNHSERQSIPMLLRGPRAP